MITRPQDWPARLTAYIEKRRSMPFAWGTQDCCQFVRGGFEAVTGIDPASDWGIQSYKTSKGAASLLRKLGGLESLPPRAGCAEIPLLMASRGDVVLVPNADYPALGIVLGVKVAFPGETGLAFVPLQVCTKAWRVG